jgi:hypothetical protein
MARYGSGTSRAPNFSGENRVEYARNKMRKTYRLIVILLVWAIYSIACNLTLLPESAPVGQFSCDAIENGAFTTCPVFEIFPGGKVVVMGKEGNWEYDTEKKVFTFSGEVSLQNAKYKKGNDSWLIAIQPDYQANYQASNFVNADEGKLRCYLTKPGQ